LSNEICRNSGYVAGTSVCCPIEETTSNPRTNPDNGAVSLNGPECGLSSVFKFRRVVGGEPSELGTWPWITLLGYDVLEGSPFKCGGSLITKRHVLTAAHCIRKTTTVDINIVKMDRHPQYNSRNGKNDIAILHLESPVSYTERIHPACLPKDPPLRTRSFVDYMPFV
uniref:Peptidase S1 domain-containing protein n=1 Tax=Megaselia scalaris TaxID=36166 RepID=T1GYZ1_MEGSC